MSTCHGLHVVSDVAHVTSLKIISFPDSTPQTNQSLFPNPTMNSTKNGGPKGDEGQRSGTVYMCGYLPGASPERSPLTSPVPVRLGGGDSFAEACGGGCGFAMAISGSGKLITWGSVEDEGQSYLTSGKHMESPEPYPLPTEASVVKAAAGWAHCVTVIETGEVYTWGWRECIPSGTNDYGSLENYSLGIQSSMLKEQASNLIVGVEGKKCGEEVVKRRKTPSIKQDPMGLTPCDEFFTFSPYLVSFGSGVKITGVAAGGRHTLALSDKGQVWGWGYGGEGQLGLGTRVKTISSPYIIPCIEPFSGVPGSFVKEIACGGRHSIIMTDVGSVLTFGWGLYGQCGQGGTYDQLRPTYVNSLSGVTIEKISAGLWHSLCVSSEGRAFAFGGNQFGQLGTGVEQAETLPRLLDSPRLEGKNAKLVSCGARHSVIVTEDGVGFSWGWNKYGQLGLGDSVDRSTPSQVSVNGVIKNVACGWWHTLFLAES